MSQNEIMGIYFMKKLISINSKWKDDLPEEEQVKIIEELKALHQELLDYRENKDNIILPDADKDS